MPPTKATPSGEVRIIDSRNFPVSTHVAAAYVIVKPGGLRELHWHPNADEWQYYVQGRGRMTLFINGGKARTADFKASDVGYVPRTLGHYIENMGDTDLISWKCSRPTVFKTCRSTTGSRTRRLISSYSIWKSARQPSARFPRASATFCRADRRGAAKGLMHIGNIHL